MLIEMHIAVEPAINETIVEEASFVVLHKAIINETTEFGSDAENSTENFVSESMETSSSTKVDVNSTTPVIVTTIEEKEVSTVHVENESTAVPTKDEATTTTVETTIESTMPTSAIPADCPVLKDCPSDSCSFARKLDNRGCPTCNCLQSSKSNLTCLPLTCPGCLYGHYTDSDGVCSFI